jgi:hypothetical protein
MNFKQFIRECHEKDVFKNLSIYVVSSWVLIQVFSVIYEPFGLPKISMTYLLLVLIVGFPFYIYLLWRYRLKPLESKLSRREGLKVSAKSAGSREELKGLKKRKIHLPGIHFYSPFQKMYFTTLFVITLVAVFSASLIVKANFINQEDPSVFAFADEPDNKRIAVLEFDNNTADSEFDVIGKMAADWIMHGITQNKVGQVISPKIVEDYSHVLKASMVPSEENGVLKEFLKPSKVISGTYFRNKDKLVFQCSVLNGNMNKTLISFEEIECDSDTPLDCIEAIRQRVLGYLDSQDSKLLMDLEETPPKYEAYKLMLKAEEEIGEADYLRYVDEAIAADSSYFKPKVDRILYYYNNDDFAIADSLLGVLSIDIGTNKKQLNMINHLEACLRGDNRTAYKTYKEEYSDSPDDLELNMSTMVLALQFVNRPQDVDAVYETMDMTDFDIENCVQCEYRYFVKGVSNLELGKVQETIDLLSPFARSAGFQWIKTALVKAHIKAGNTAAVRDIVEIIRLLDEVAFWEQSMLVTSLEFLKIGNKSEAETYLDQLLAFYNEKGNTLSEEQKGLQAKAFFFREQYGKAELLLRELSKDIQEDHSILALLAIIQHKNGAQSEAEATLARLNRQRSKFQFGNVDYALAQYYAAVGEEEKAMGYLLEAVASGKRFTNGTFQNDILFQPYLETEAFRKIATFWY